MTPLSDYKFCPKCGGPLRGVPRRGAERLQCGACGFILYRNPVVGVAGIVMEERRVLLGRRVASVSGGGRWCIPCGYVEWGEDVRDAVRWELLEETGLEVRISSVYAVHSNFHNPQSLTVGIWFRADAVGGKLRPGDDLDDAGFFSLDALPEPLAFPTDRLVLEDLRRGH